MRGMAQVLTVKCRVEVPESIRSRVDATLRAFADACNEIRSVAEAAGITNKFQLQHSLYHELRRQFGMSSNLTIRAIARVASVLKAKHIHPIFHPTSVDYDQRIFRFQERNWSVRLMLIGGACWFQLAIGPYQRKLLAGRCPTSARLVKRKNSHYYLHIAIEARPAESRNPVGSLGVDLGIRNIASLSTGERFGGADVEAIRDHHQAMRQALQRKGTKGAKRLLKRLSGRERRFMAWVNHTISARIIRFARFHNLAVALEDLTGIRKRAKLGKAHRQRHHRWCFQQLRHCLEYKALRDGVRLTLISPAYTSKSCHRCLRIGARRGESFRCGHCGYVGHADYNGACMISKLGECVTLPEHSLACLMAG